MFSLRIPLSVCALSAVLSTLNVLLPVAVVGQEPPLFQPLVSLNRRQRDLNDPDLYVADYYPQSPAPLELPRYHYQYQFDDRNFRPADEDYVRGENSGFQSYPVEYPGPRVLEKTLSDFLEENISPKDDSNEEINKRVLTSFRERMEREKSKEQHEKLAEMFLQKLQEEADDRNVDRDYDNRDYIEMIEELWTKYRNTHPNKESPIFVEEMRKRQIPVDYSSLGWSGVGYKKRSPPSDNDVFFLKYPQKDVYEDDSSRLHYNMLKPMQSDYSYRSYNPEYLYAKRKRFPVTKRSSNFYGKSIHHKRGVNANKKMKKDGASGTDPKVVKDLSNIFGAKDSKKQNATSGLKEKKYNEKNSKLKDKKTSSSITVTSTIAPETKPITVKSDLTQHEHNHKTEHHSGVQHNKQKETTIDEPLNIKKKSIDWSNYFGIDRRRKKSESFTNDNDIDNDWLVKRYNNAVAMAVKRSSEYPLNFFRNHDAKRDSHKQESNQQETNDETTTKSSDDTKLGDMDDKLKNIEDLIIDEALKYTGAHEGETDPKEIQEIKDKVISRLAAAYSLEKMRRALSEFKSSLAAQKYAGKNVEIENPEEAEDAMKKKSPEPENSKGNGDEDFSSRSGNEIDADKFADSLVSGSGNCNAIENRCRRLVKNGFGGAFYPICKWHQLCYLCGTDTESSEELTACDVMFLSRAAAICQADVVCQWAARPAVNFLRNIHETAPRELATRCESNTCDVTERVFNIKRR